MLNRLGYRPERATREFLESRFPSWNPDLYSDGFFHSIGGFAQSSLVIECLAAEARALGVDILEGVSAGRLIETGNVIRGIETSDGVAIEADETILAAGAWTPRWLPELKFAFTTVAQPVFYLQPRDPQPFRSGVFPVFTADIKKTGWYGVPSDTRGIVKLANHGPGRLLDPDDDRRVLEKERGRLRGFLEESFPDLAGARISGEKVCIYCDTQDGDFLITRHPERKGLTLATGGSGHAFKFAPVMGGWIADAVAGWPNSDLARFYWRELGRGIMKSESARFEG
jgi:glycine/D-amino acid oxidase-like deaminating enzyme